ncbi:hypothetical protein BpHYR1_018314, partial [Brachionus plicatilis]
MPSKVLTHNRVISGIDLYQKRRRSEPTAALNRNSRMVQSSRTICTNWTVATYRTVPTVPYQPYRTNRTVP